MKTKISSDLRAAKALIDTPEKWTQGYYARDAAGNAVETFSEAACSFCMVGALKLATGTFGSNAHFALEGFIESSLGRNASIPRFNDAPGRTHEEVMAMFDKAIAAAEAAGGAA